MAYTSCPTAAGNCKWSVIHCERFYPGLSYLIFVAARSSSVAYTILSARKPKRHRSQRSLNSFPHCWIFREVLLRTTSLGDSAKMKVGNQGIVLAAVLGLCGIAPCRLPRCSGSDAPSVRLRALPVLYCESSRGGREVRVKLTAWNRATDGPIQRTANSEPFEEVARRAQEALEADRFPEAVRLYERATKLRPDWPEGWWHLGTLLFDAGRLAEARDAFAHFVSVERRQPGPGFGMLGLSQFQLKQYHKALAALEQGQKVGLGTDPAFVHKVLLHDGILNTLLGKPEVALQRLNLVANLTAAAHPEAPTDSVFQDIELLDAFGTAALRIPKLPSDVTSAQMPVVRRAGRAQAFIALQDRVAAEAEFKQLLALYPSEP